MSSFSLPAGFSSGPRKKFPPFSGVGLSLARLLRLLFFETYQTGRCPLPAVTLAVAGVGSLRWDPSYSHPSVSDQAPGCPTSHTFLCFPELWHFLSLLLGWAMPDGHQQGWRCSTNPRGAFSPSTTPGGCLRGLGPCSPGDHHEGRRQAHPPRPGAAPVGSGVPRGAPARRREERAAPCEPLAAGSGPRGRQMG